MSKLPAEVGETGASPPPLRHSNRSGDCIFRARGSVSDLN